MSLLSTHTYLGNQYYFFKHENDEGSVYLQICVQHAFHSPVHVNILTYDIFIYNKNYKNSNSTKDNLLHFFGFVDNCDKLTVHNDILHYNNEDDVTIMHCWVKESGDKFLSFKTEHYNHNAHGAIKSTFTIPYPSNFKEIIIKLLEITNDDA
jgi:hypothetical protein